MDEILGMLALAIIGLVFQGLLFLLYYFFGRLYIHQENKKRRLRYLYGLVNIIYSDTYITDTEITNYFKKYPKELKRAKLIALKKQAEEELTKLEERK